jgi:ferritin-like metal-binding protein YciE
VARIHSRTEQLVTWLDDAHAMESGLIGILENHASHFAEVSPHASRRLQQHVVETQQHVQRLTECLRMLNTTPSGVKSTLSAAAGALESAATAIFRTRW